ncbi:MAG: 2Fe-2S iron-sulfur cluster binding domain-containing protein [Gammaproteobacteria bacterium]|nr:MAG: 2Fe-2S iron-sulfur cluster binding domain-containing protein [Gammaproteobacteria bacterium]
MATIYVTDREGNEHVLQMENGANLMEQLREIDGGVEALCGGMCSCATCHVFIEAEWSAKLGEARDDELELLEDTECFAGGRSRLACQIKMTDELDGMRLTVAPEE